ncbi:MAG: TAXI family TRAP transporter solute-binding subunit [Deltaproteobacteria bacterium]|nr:TAXI family TRAP transporter solute-binding subunit [Deltaproteobacteria bacterium]
MKIIKKMFIAVLILSLALLTGLGAGFAADKFISFGSGGPGGTWFTMVGGMSVLLTKEIKGLNVTSQACAGSLENNRRLRQGAIELCLTHGLTSYQNWNGLGPFQKEGPFHDFGMLCGVYSSWHHFVTLEKSGIKTLKDLVGKRVSVGEAGSGSAVNSENILRALGLWDKIKVEHLGFGEAGRALGDGNVDALTQSSAPMANVVTLEATHKIFLIPINDDEAKQIMAKYPYFTRAVMPGGTYKTWKKEYPCVSFSVYMQAHKKLEPEWVYKILKVAFDPKSKEYLVRVHKQWAPLKPDLDGIKGLGIPLHAGALQFWKEKGLKIPPEIIPQ